MKTLSSPGLEQVQDGHPRHPGTRHRYGGSADLNNASFYPDVAFQIGPILGERLETGHRVVNQGEYRQLQFSDLTLC